MFDKIGKSFGKAILKEVLKGPSIPTTVPQPLNLLKDFYDSPHRKKETIFDTIFNDNVEPGIGALVYCELFKMEHSGIYLGGNRIAQLNGKGNIEVVSPSSFTDNITTIDRDIFIPVKTDGTPISLYTAAENAKKMIGNKRDYNLILDNCHQFCSGCITGDFDNVDNFLVFTKNTFYNAVYDKVKWQRWKWYK